eukprot:NODE_26749_length_539_cov_3.026699.p2 GENE.NODE_26749_length_539_cov_3.026699~~NODE_26749_length_539_cov_3.026699.p2  ORF type:complete len:94 (+),score=28.27 NODE_26749_length_539_cov_3.026699:141-422(+)
MAVHLLNLGIGLVLLCGRPFLKAVVKSGGRIAALAFHWVPEPYIVHRLHSGAGARVTMLHSINHQKKKKKKKKNSARLLKKKKKNKKKRGKYT